MRTALNSFAERKNVRKKKEPGEAINVAASLTKALTQRGDRVRKPQTPIADDDPFAHLPAVRTIRAGGRAAGSSASGAPDARTACAQRIAATVSHAKRTARDQLPDDVRKMRTWALAQIGHIAAGIGGSRGDRPAVQGADTPQAYGDMPLIVITRGRPESDWTAAKEDARRAAHKVIASASRCGRWLIGERSGDHVQIDQPDVVIAALKTSCRPLRTNRLPVQRTLSQSRGRGSISRDEPWMRITTRVQNELSPAGTLNVVVSCHGPLPR